ncbi:MAG: hypothetical protein FIB04_13380 [Gammaproteobacteria bacterium]|nr:hypothetical protein [Gammaproteobacteria bacterium]
MNHVTTRDTTQRNRLLPLALAVVGACLTAGCASDGSTSSAWATGAPRDKTYSKVLIVGVSASEDSRCMFENFMVSQLASPSTQAIASCRQATPVTPPTRESVAKMVADTGADAVLATRLVAARASTQNDGSRDDRGGYFFKSEGVTDVVGPWGFYDLPAVYGQYENFPALNLLEGQVTVSSNFYSTQAAMLVCTLTTTVKNLATSDNAAAAVANAIAARLQGDGLVK